MNRKKPVTNKEEPPNISLALTEKMDITEAEVTAAAEALGCAKLSPQLIKSLAILGYQLDGYRTLQGRVVIAQSRLESFVEFFLKELVTTEDGKKVDIGTLIEGAKAAAQLEKAVTERFRVSKEITDSGRTAGGGAGGIPAIPKKSFPGGTLVVANNVQVNQAPQEKVAKPALNS